MYHPERLRSITVGSAWKEPSLLFEFGAWALALLSEASVCQAVLFGPYHRLGTASSMARGRQRCSAVVVSFVRAKPE